MAISDADWRRRNGISVAAKCELKPSIVSLFCFRLAKEAQAIPSSFMWPGAMEFTLMFGANSTAMARLKPITAAFEALYTEF